MTSTINNTNTRPFSKVLIAGAGPSGLLLALLLAQRNIPSIVLEAWEWLDTRLRATQYGVPATRIFRRAGLLPDIRAASIPKFPVICWRRVADGEKLVEIDMSVVEDEEDRLTVLQLGEIIQIMYKHCMDPEKGKGLIDVRFNHKVIATGQDGTKAWVDAEIGKDGEEKRHERIEADYLVGCDGAGSAVRKSLFSEWPGQTFDWKFMVQNVYYDGFDKYGWDGGNYM
jgi:2-polyprenyl-6-methoxyphenol hydroxylase-like FAD-dependent oxidoreductase